MYMITKLTLRLGIHSTYHGSRYIRYGIMLCLENEDYLLEITQRLYADIAEHFHVLPPNVEYCIRTAISTCWNRGNRELLRSIARYELKTRPTNGEFFDILYCYLKSQETAVS